MFTYEPLKNRNEHYGIDLDDADRETFLVSMAVAAWLRSDRAIGETDIPSDIAYEDAKELVSSRAVRMSYHKGRIGFTDIEVVQSGTGRMVLKVSQCVTDPVDLFADALVLLRHFRSRCESIVETEVAEVGREPLHEIDDEIAPLALMPVPPFIEFTSMFRAA